MKWWRVRRRLRIRPGDLYEDCFYHPMLCIEAEPLSYYWGWRGWLNMWRDTDLTGISLWDLSRRSCSARHCAPEPMTVKQLFQKLEEGPHA